MEIKIISTGSKGNCYVMKHNDDTIIIDAGLSYNEILKNIDYKIASINGVLISHQHL